MLSITIPAIEMFDDVKQEFITIKGYDNIQLEHSLVSISKWEAKWGKPFLSKVNKTKEETIDYIRCMTITQNVDPSVYGLITRDISTKIEEYISAPMSATTISNNNNIRNNEIVTSEVIYYYMVALTIPFECQKWHLNRLLTLINICNIKNTPPKKTSQKEIINRNKDLNSARRAAMNSNG